MNDLPRIPAEILQQLTARQAWEYGLIPYRLEDGILMCYGEEGKDYALISMEFEIVTGFIVEVNPLPFTEMERRLNFYYREREGKGQGMSHQITTIENGQHFLMGLIGEAFAEYASDIHFEPYEDRCRIRFRMDGKLLEKYVIIRQHYTSLVNQVKILSNLDISEKRLPQDGRILYDRDNKKFDVRVSALPTIYGEKIVLRLLTRHAELLDLENLGFTEKQREDYFSGITHPHGLVLISGPTGSGKSTTLYATLRELNKESNNILTIEDPVEYTLEGVNQVQLKEEIGLTFPNALRTFLRQDPDIIMLGEIRDGDTAQMAIRSSLTGHLIFSTIHTNNAWGSVARLVDMGVHPYLISNTLVLCVAQRLLRLLCPACKKQQVISEAVRREAGLDVVHTHCYAPTGCVACYYTGYKGRKAIYEVIPMDEELTQAVRDNRGEIDREMRDRGIVSLRDSAVGLFQRGDTSLDELLPLLKSQ